jgi:cytochrome c biogenesis protein ResB
MQKIKRFFLSRKTILFLISAVGISCLVGSTIPQVARKPAQFFETWKAKSPIIYKLVDLLQVNQVYTSIWFLVLVALIACSLALTIYFQSKELIKSRRPAQRKISQGSFKHYHVLKSVQSPELKGEKFTHEIEGVLKDDGYRSCLVTEGNRYHVFDKNSWGRWGSVIFHMGLLFMVVAALYNVAFHKRGIIQLIQTDTFQGKNKDWGGKWIGVFAGDFDLGFQVCLEKFVPTYWENDQVKTLESSLRIIDEKGGVEKSLLSRGSPVRFKGTRIYQSRNYGYALGFVLKGEDGKEDQTHFFLKAPEKKDQPFARTVGIPGTDYVLDMTFYPDLTKPSFHVTLPGMHLTVTEKGEQRFKGRVLYSQRARINKDTLTFAQINYWTELLFVKNDGVPLVYLGFASGVLGALLIFMLPYKKVHLKVAEEGEYVRLYIGGHTKRYQTLFAEEFKELAERLERMLEKHGFHRAN